MSLCNKRIPRNVCVAFWIRPTHKSVSASLCRRQKNKTLFDNIKRTKTSDRLNQEITTITTQLSTFIFIFLRILYYLSDGSKLQQRIMHLKHLQNLTLYMKQSFQIFQQHMYYYFCGNCTFVQVFYVFSTCFCSLYSNYYLPFNSTN